MKQTLKAYYPQDTVVLPPNNSYFVLPYGETIQNGDYFYNPNFKKWDKVINTDAKVGSRYNQFAYCRQIVGNEDLYNQMEHDNILNTEPQKPISYVFEDNKIDYNKYPNFVVRIESQKMWDIVLDIAVKYGMKFRGIGQNKIPFPQSNLYFTRKQKRLGFLKKDNELSYANFDYDCSEFRGSPIYDANTQLNDIIKHLEVPLTVTPSKLEAPVINGYTMTIHHNENGIIVVNFGCANIRYQILKDIDIFNTDNLDLSNRTIKSIELSSGVKITDEQIKHIVDYCYQEMDEKKEKKGSF